MNQSVLCTSVLAAIVCLGPLAQQGNTQTIWVTRDRLASLPTSGPAWDGLLAAASRSCGTPDLSNQDDAANVCVMAKALVFARTGQTQYRDAVVDALWVVSGGSYSGRALALGRELPAYVIAADLIDLRNHYPGLDQAFRDALRRLLATPTSDGPRSLIECHEARPNNWGTHCGAARAAVAAYLGDTEQLGRVAQVFRGWLGDRAAYAGFQYGDLAWQCDASHPVGVNPAGCSRDGHPIDGVLPDDQRRTGGFTWPAPQENYAYEALQGALAQAVILHRAGFDAFEWEHRALLRAFRWLHSVNAYAAEGDDTWQPHVVNHFYAAAGADFPGPSPSRPGKNVGWTDWTHAGAATELADTSGSTASAPGAASAPGSGSTGVRADVDAYVRGGVSAAMNFGTERVLEIKTGNGSTSEYDRQAYLRFNLSSQPYASRALLRVNVTALPNGTPADLCAYRLASDTWNEQSLTWNTRPAPGARIVCRSISATGWVTFDLTSYVTQELAGDRMVSVVLSDDAAGNRMVRLASREAAGAEPTLELTLGSSADSGSDASDPGPGSDSGVDGSDPGSTGSSSGTESGSTDGSGASTSTLTLAWDPSATTGVAGYRVYVGQSSGAYTSTYDVGNVTSFRLTSAQPGVTYYFAVAAYTSGGSVGTLSREVSGAASGSSAEPTQPSPSTGSGSSVLTVGADTYVRGGEFASSNYGAASVLEAKHAGGSSQEYDRQIYLRFDLAGMVAPVASVSLRMYVEGLPNGTPANVCAYQVGIDSWSEGTLVWNNRPEAGGTIGCRSVSASGWVSFDVSAYVVQQLGSDRIASFVLADTTGGNRMVRFASRESGANAPVLQID